MAHYGKIARARFTILVHIIPPCTGRMRAHAYQRMLVPRILIVLGLGVQLGGLEVSVVPGFRGRGFVAVQVAGDWGLALRGSAEHLEF